MDVLLADGAYDVILCDLIMPGLSGIDVYEELARQRPGVEQRIVFFTGGACSMRARRFLSRVPNRALEKPLRAQALLDAVRVVMSPRNDMREAL